MSKAPLVTLSGPSNTSPSSLRIRQAAVRTVAGATVPRNLGSTKPGTRSSVACVSIPIFAHPSQGISTRWLITPSAVPMSARIVRVLKPGSSSMSLTMKGSLPIVPGSGLWMTIDFSTPTTHESRGSGDTVTFTLSAPVSTCPVSRILRVPSASSESFSGSTTRRRGRRVLVTQRPSSLQNETTSGLGSPPQSALLTQSWTHVPLIELPEMSIWQ